MLTHCKNTEIRTRVVNAVQHLDICPNQCTKRFEGLLRSVKVFITLTTERNFISSGNPATAQRLLKQGRLVRLRLSAQLSHLVLNYVFLRLTIRLLKSIMVGCVRWCFKLELS